MTETRLKIVRAYARWTALSALRSGAPVKSREAIYPLLRTRLFLRLEDAALGSVTKREFDAWHERACAAIIREPRLQVGWAAKLLNVYLKTFAYVGRAGRPGLAAVLHPPIDAGLWLGLKCRFAVKRPDILELTHCVKRIKNIADYACYLRIIAGCRLAAAALGCTLLEVDQLWAGTELRQDIARRS